MTTDIPENGTSGANIELRAVPIHILHRALKAAASDDTCIAFADDGRVSMLMFNTIDNDQQLPGAVTVWLAGKPREASEFYEYVKLLRAREPVVDQPDADGILPDDKPPTPPRGPGPGARQHEPAPDHVMVKGGIAEKAMKAGGMYLPKSAAEIDKSSATFRGAEQHEFFTIDMRLVIEVLVIGYRIGKPTELLGLYVMLCRGAMCGETRWSVKALKKYLGIRKEIGNLLMDALTKHGLISKDYKQEGRTYRAIRTYAQWRGIEAEPQAISKQWQAIIGRAFVDGECVPGAGKRGKERKAERKAGPTIDAENIALRRILALGMKAGHRADNAAALALFIAMRSRICDLTVTGGIPVTAMYRDYGRPELVAGQHNRVAVAFDMPEGPVELDTSTRAGTLISQVLAPTGSTVDAAMSKLLTLSLATTVAVVADNEVARYAIPNVEQLTSDVTDRITHRVEHKSRFNDSVFDMLEGRVVLPFHRNDTPSVREAYVAAYAPLTKLMKKVGVRLADQNKAPLKTLDAIDAEADQRGTEGGLKLVSEFIAEAMEC